MESTDSEEIQNPFGVVRPFDETFPTEDNLKSNEEMEAYLVNYCNVYETKVGQRRRLRVIDKLGSIIAKWAKEVARQKNVPPESIGDLGGIQLRIFGSTRLGVHNPDSDIDMLCIAPGHITRADFFGSFVTILCERVDVESVCAIPDAYTPVVKFNVDGQAIDMIFTSLQVPSVSKDIDILDVKVLTALDDQSVRSLNGARVAEWILRLVPNADTFCSTLRVIKFWARQRGIYSNVLGFLGGVNYAILVALVCQLYRNKEPYTLVRSFFEVLAGWRWPTPVMIRSFEDLQYKDTDGRYLPVWNPKLNPRDGLHLMPIITPAYPAMNSAYNVSYPQFRYIQEELLRARHIFQTYDYFGSTGPFPWPHLCELATSDFFRKCPRYIQVDISSDNASNHRNWFGWVESRLRTLIVALEQPPVTFCHPMASCFHRQVAVPTAIVAPATVESNSGSRKVNNTVKSEDLNSIGPARKGSTSRNDSINSDSTSSLPGLSIDTMKVEDRGSAGSATVQKVEGGNAVLSINASPPIGGEDHHSLEGEGGEDLARSPSKGRGCSVDESMSSTFPASGDVRYISSFFVGLSFQKGAYYADVSPAIQVRTETPACFLHCPTQSIWLLTILCYHIYCRSFNLK